jgi:hypothetical protein
MRQIVVEIPTTSRDLGSSDLAGLQAAFPGSPIHSGDIDDQSIKDQAELLLITGDVEPGGAAHYGFASFNRDYVDSPNIDDVTTGGGGLPGSPHTPAPGSPGAGSMNPADIPAPPSNWPPDEGTEYGSGQGGLYSPHNASQVVAQQTIGDLTLGTSS